MKFISFLNAPKLTLAALTALSSAAWATPPVRVETIVPLAPRPSDEAMAERAVPTYSEDHLDTDDREQLRRLIQDSRPEVADRKPAVLGPATDEPVAAEN